MKCVVFSVQWSANLEFTTRYKATSKVCHPLYALLHWLYFNENLEEQNCCFLPTCVCWRLRTVQVYWAASVLVTACPAPRRHSSMFAKRPLRKSWSVGNSMRWEESNSGPYSIYYQQASCSGQAAFPPTPLPTGVTVNEVSEYKMSSKHKKALVCLIPSPVLIS